MEAPTTRRPNGHHLPAIPGARSRGPAPSGRTSPPFPRRPSGCDRQRFTQAPTRQQTVRPARPPPPSQGRRPTRYRGDGTLRTPGQGDPQPTGGPNRGRGDEPLKPPPCKQAVKAPAPDTGIGHSTNWAHTPRGSPPRLRRSQAAGAQRTHHNNWDTTQATRGRTKKWQRPPALRSPVAHRPPPRPVRCSRNRSSPRGTYLGNTLAPPQGTPPRLAPHRTRTRRPCPPKTPRPPQRRNTNLFDEAEPRAVYDIHANTAWCGLVAALQEHLQDVNPNKLFSVVYLPHAASTDISVRQLQALVPPGMQMADDLVDAWIW